MTASGMSVGLVHDVPTVAELMERIVEEAKSVQLNLSASMAVSNAVSSHGVTHAEAG
jgi:enoyl-[acyl-carrier protein] reductase II